MQREKEWSWKEALEHALKHGRSGYWTHDNLEQLIEGRGPILELAMWDGGFRPHKRISGRWVIRTPKYEEDLRKERGKEESSIESEELTKLLDTPWAFPNKLGGIDHTYKIQVDNMGQIYIYLFSDPPFAYSIRGQQLDKFAEVLSNRGHINKKQNGFYIHAKNVKLGEEKGVHIKAVKPDETYTECIWPHLTPNENIYNLADDLVSRVNRI